MKRSESGVGLVEVMVAAAILSTSVAGSIYLTSTSAQLSASSSSVVDGAAMGSSVVEIAQFKPDASYVNTQIGSMQTSSSRSAFTLDGVSVSSAGSTDGVSVSVSWTNPYLESSNKTQRFTLGSNVTSNTSFQTLQQVVGADSGGQQTTTYTVSTSAGAGTTISPSSAQVSSGGSTSFTVTLSSGYDTLVVSGCGGSLVGNTYTTGAITADCTVTAGATEITYTVSTSSGTGVASLSCNDSTVTYGGSTTCTASLATGYESLTLSGCSGTAGGSPYSTGAIYADCTVSGSNIRDGVYGINISGYRHDLIAVLRVCELRRDNLVHGGNYRRLYQFVGVGLFRGLSVGVNLYDRIDNRRLHSDLNCDRKCPIMDGCGEFYCK